MSTSARLPNPETYPTDGYDRPSCDFRAYGGTCDALADYEVRRMKPRPESRLRCKRHTAGYKIVAVVEDGTN